jgi:hypothetical protein
LWVFGGCFVGVCGIPTVQQSTDTTDRSVRQAVH